MFFTLYRFCDDNPIYPCFPILIVRSTQHALIKFYLNKKRTYKNARLRFKILLSDVVENNKQNAANGKDYRSDNRELFKFAFGCFALVLRIEGFRLTGNRADAGRVARLNENYRNDENRA